jgi:hypothetical protein
VHTAVTNAIGLIGKEQIHAAIDKYSKAMGFGHRSIGHTLLDPVLTWLRTGDKTNAQAALVHILQDYASSGVRVASSQIAEAAQKIVDELVDNGYRKSSDRTKQSEMSKKIYKCPYCQTSVPYHALQCPGCKRPVKWTSLEEKVVVGKKVEPTGNKEEPKQVVQGKIVKRK